jgi:alpha-tubulin suppressor-like RCC1 family protein
MSHRVVPVLLVFALAGCGDNAATATSPRLVIESPKTGSVLETAAASLTFRVEDALAFGYTITIGDTRETTSGKIAIGDPITVTLTLHDGVNTITVGVLGEHAEVADEETVVLVVDGDRPLVELTAPSAGAETHSAAVEVAGRVFTPRAITSAMVRVGGGNATALALTPATNGYTFLGTASLVLGPNDLEIEIVDDHDQRGSANASITRLLDDAGPTASVAFPRDGQAVRTRTVLVRGTVADQSSIATVAVELGTQSIAATLAPDGTYTAVLELAPADNLISVRSTDEHGNASTRESHIYYGTRLASGGAHGGAIRSGKIYTWGRNNLGQTGLDFVSHESRTAYCDRTQSTPRDVALCRATTISAIDAICLNPGFVTPTPADGPEAASCRAAARAYRDTVCDAAGAGAPTNCKTSTSANLATACDAAYGTSTPASNACEAHLVCDGAYAAGSPERASCTAVAGAVPSVFPSPAAPYSPVEIANFSTTAALGGGATFASLGVDFTSLAFNQNASSAIDSSGRVWSWGDGASGILCLGDTAARIIPHRVDDFGAAGTTAIALSRGYDHVLILRSDGTVWGCGLNNVGQIGDGTSGTNRSLPTQVVGLPANIVQVLASSQSSYALTADGEVYAWGRNQYGNLGNGTASSSTTAAPTPALVPGLAAVVMIASGRDHVLAVTSSGTVWGWGLNASHQINAAMTNVLSPVQIEGVTDARAVYANGNQGFFEDSMGRLFGWGQNGNGNLGIPEDDDMPAPTSSVFGLANVLDVAVGALQGFAMRDGQVFGWGWSFHGSLGAGESAIHAWPYRVPLLVQLPN